MNDCVKTSPHALESQEFPRDGKQHSSHAHHLFTLSIWLSLSVDALRADGTAERVQKGMHCILEVTVGTSRKFRNMCQEKLRAII